MIRSNLTRPSTTISAAALAGALTTVAVSVLGRFGIVLSPEEALAAGTLIMFAAGYLVADPVMRKQILEELAAQSTAATGEPEQHNDTQ